MFMTFLYCCMGKVYPFSASQFLIIEFFVLGLPSFCIAVQPTSKHVSGQFIWNVLRTSFCSGMSLIVCVLVVFALVGFPQGAVYANPEVAGGWSAVTSLEATAGTYALVFSGYAALLLICMPPDKFRLAVIGVSLVLLAVALPVGSYYIGNYFELILPGTDTIFIGWDNVLWIVIGIVSGILVNLGLSYLDKKLRKRGAYDKLEALLKLKRYGKAKKTA